MLENYLEKDSKEANVPIKVVQFGSCFDDNVNEDDEHRSNNYEVRGHVIRSNKNKRKAVSNSKGTQTGNDRYKVQDEIREMPDYHLNSNTVEFKVSQLGFCDGETSKSKKKHKKFSKL